MEKEIEDGEITDYDGPDEDMQNTVPNQTITLNHHSGQTGLNEVRHNDNNTTYYDRDARPRTETTDHERPIIEYDDVPYIELDEWSPENDLTTMTDKKSRSQTINKENATSIKLAETATHAQTMHSKRNKNDNHNTQKNEPTRNSNSKHSSFESRGIDAHSSDKQYNNKNRFKRSRSRESSERDGHEKSKRRKISQFPRGNHKTSSSSGRNRTDSHKGRNGTDSPRGRYGPDPSRGRNGIDLRRGRNRTYSPVRGNSSMSDDRNSSSGKYDQKLSTRHSASKPRFIDHRVPTKVSSTEHCNDTDERINKIKEHVLREQNKRLENCSSTKLFENGEPVESRFSPDRVQENRPSSSVSERSSSPNQDILSSFWASEETTCNNFGLKQEQEARQVVNDSTPYKKKDEVVAHIYLDNRIVNSITENPQMKWSEMALKNGPEYISLESNDNNDNLDNGQYSVTVHGVTPQSSSLAVLMPTKSKVETKEENTDLTERGTEQGNETVIAALSTSDFQVQNEISDFGENEMLLANGLEMKNVVTQLIQDVKVKVKCFDENEAIPRVDTQEKRCITETVISGDIEDVLLKRNDQAVSIYDSSDDANLDKTVSGSTSDVKDFCSTKTAIDSQMAVETSPNQSSKATQIKQFLQNRRRGLTADIRSGDDFVISSDDSGITHSLYDSSVASTPPRDESKSPLPETSSSCLPAWTPVKPTSSKHTVNNKDVPYSIGECAEMRSNKSKLPEDESVSTVHNAGELALKTTEDNIEMELKDEDYIEPYEECANGIKHIEEIKHTNDSENDAVGGNETDTKYNSDNDNENQTVSEWCDSRKVMIKSETKTENGKDLDSENNTDLENETKFDTNIEYVKDNKENTERVFEMDMLDSERRNAFDEKIARREINVKEIESGEEMDIHDFERSEACNDIADNDTKEDGDNGMVNDQIQEPGNESVTGATDDDVNTGDVHMVNGIANGNADGIAIVEELSMELKGKNTSGKTRYRHISGYWQMATSSGLWKDLDAEDAMALQNAVNIWKKYSSEN